MSEFDSPNPPEKPDLADEMNVAETHGHVDEQMAAASREKRLKESGLEPISPKLMLWAALPLLVAGAVIGKGTFSYKSLWADRYEPPKGVEAEGPVSGPALEAYMKEGAKIYAKCNGCHGATGTGDGGYPPLAGSEWVTGDTEAFSAIILRGLVGPIEVAGKTWNVAGGMTSQAEGLGARELATLMTYVRNSFGNETGDVVTLEMAQQAIDLYKQSDGSQITAEELQEKHMKMLEGEPLAPDTVVDLETLELIEGAE